MCLGEIARVVELGPESTALVRSLQRDSRVSLLTLDGPVAVGEWLVCHSGFALGRVSADEARAASSIRATTATATTSATAAGAAAPPVTTRKDRP